MGLPCERHLDPDLPQPRCQPSERIRHLWFAQVTVVSLGYLSLVWLHAASLGTWLLFAW
jgi:hypothetical protein